jgi:hypothetical protein
MELGDAHEKMSVLVQEHAELQQTCERLVEEAAVSQTLKRVGNQKCSFCACLRVTASYSSIMAFPIVRI